MTNGEATTCRVLSGSTNRSDVMIDSLTNLYKAHTFSIRMVKAQPECSTSSVIQDTSYGARLYCLAAIRRKSEHSNDVSVCLRSHSYLSSVSICVPY